MAKRDKSLEDLDEELARLEAELAALERGETPVPTPKAATPPKEKKALSTPKLPFGRKKEATPATPAPEPAAPVTEDAPVPVADQKAAHDRAAKKLLGRLRMPGRKVESAPAEAPAPDPAEPVEAAPAPTASEPAPAAAPAPSGPRAIEPPPLDGAAWSREGGVWRRTAPAKPLPVYRRTLDAEGHVLEEVPAADDEAAHARPADPQAPVEGKRFSFGLPKLGRQRDDAPPAEGAAEEPKRKLNFRLGKLGRKP